VSQPLLIDGRAAEDAAFRRVEIRAPWDGAVIGTTFEADWPAMDAAIAAATRAFEGWQATPRDRRRDLLRRIAATVRERAEELATLMAREVGKPITWARAEVTRLGITFDLAAGVLEGPAREELPLDFDSRGKDYRCFVERMAIGPVLAIVPYNWPYNLAAHKLAPALAAGNTVVLKPSPQAPLSTLALAHLVHGCGLAAGVVNAVNCTAEAAEQAVRDPRIPLVSFTGSERVGWHIKSLVPEKQVVLELGGDANVLVFPDADLDLATRRTCLGGYGYAGQVCIAVQHVRVHDAVYDDMKRRLVAETERTKTGDPLDPDTVCGPLISSSAADRVMSWVSEATAAGARVLAGGKREGNVVMPTLVEGVGPESKLATEEVFGPVVTLSRFDTADEAFAAANRSRFGIHCSVFTRDPAIVEQAYRELDVSGVIVNDFPTLRFDNMPYGGVKRSGIGREGVRYAYEEMTMPKVLLEQK
jgi:acyl-CoA reductase-like NAD-dependent aldehyde dehydrogenase